MTLPGGTEVTEPIVPVAIVGGGLAGLYSAHLLSRMGIGFKLIEARDRLGGRILSIGGVDLGPSWFWPSLHSRMPEIITELGLSSFEQYGEGDMLVERQPNARPLRYSGFRQEPRAMRIVGGTATLIDFLAKKLPTGSVDLGVQLLGLEIEGKRTRLTLHTPMGRDNLLADRVILALPPRLIEEQIEFLPPLDPQIRQRWRDTPTWMAPHAKFVAFYDQSFWRDGGLSGSAQSTVGPMAEIHDATTASGDAALFGFVGIDPDSRAAAGTERLKRACLDQLARLYGPQARLARAAYLMDWTAEPLTATMRDRSGSPHPLPYHGAWIDGPWGNRIWLAGSETSVIAPGYLAGALDAAERAVAEVSNKFVRASDVV